MAPICDQGPVGVLEVPRPAHVTSCACCLREAQHRRLPASAPKKPSPESLEGSTVEPRKFKHDRPRNPNHREKEHQSKSSDIHLIGAHCTLQRQALALSGKPLAPSMRDGKPALLYLLEWMRHFESYWENFKLSWVSYSMYV